MLRKILLATALIASPAFAEGEPDGPGPNLVIEIDGAAKGTVVIDLLPQYAPKHVAQIVAQAKSGAYEGVVFHRVIDGFMAQTGDVRYGKAGTDLSMAGTGDSDRPNIPAEFSDVSFQRGIVGMARAQDPDSANSQFFIMFAPGDFLDGQYTVFGHVVQGMDVVDQITRGEPPTTPDVMTKVIVQD